MSRQYTRRKMITVAAGAAAVAVGANMRTSATLRAAEGDDAIPGLDDYCRQALADWKVPGVAVAVIREGRLLLARGYGVRQLGQDAPVDENTVFFIASCTKSFTAAAIGKLMDQNKLAWDEPIGKYLSPLAAPTIVRDKAVTFRHALQHRSGLPTANMLWRSGQFQSDEILRRARLLEPVAAPGEKFLYNNVMYLAAGKAAEVASGRSWGELVRTEFFEPLDMTSSVADCARVEDFDNLAAPHATHDEEVVPIDRYCPESVAPAGAIHSSAVDMAQWLLLHLNRGRLDGRELLTAERMDEMHAPVEPPPLDPDEKGVPRSDISRYGMGWFMGKHAGLDVLEHAGSGVGFVSWMALLPRQRLGVVILSNHQRTGINPALRSWIFDRLLGRPDYDWSAAVLKDYTQGWQRLLREAKDRFDADRPPEAPATQPLADYAGAYESPLYGTIHVTEQDGQLKLRFGPRFQGELQPWQGDTFRAYFTSSSHHDWLVEFAVADGTVRSLRAREAPWAPDWYDDRDDLGEFARR